MWSYVQRVLPCCDYQASITHEEHISLELDHICRNDTVVLFNTLDRGTLKPGTYVNDNVIDFWLLWVTRTEPQNTSNVKTFTSHFYIKMVKEGVEYVLKWNENRKLDIFTKKNILLPINLSSHWPLFVVVNMHNLPTYFSGMMLLDSLGLHDSMSIVANVWKWLLYEWTTKTGNLEGKKVMQVQIVTSKGIFISKTLLPFIFLVCLFLNAFLFDIFL
jgi:Ulp1 family protease